VDDTAAQDQERSRARSPVVRSSHGRPAAMQRARRRLPGLAENNRELRKKLGIPADKPLPVEIADWRLHDLRRTATTGMARLNFPTHVVDKVLNHVSGTITGVAAVYNRFEYLDERRAALEAWGQHLYKHVTPQPSDVIAITAGA
jgi:integrase